MSGNWLALAEIGVFIVAVGGFLLWQWISLKRDMGKTAEKQRRTGAPEADMNDDKAVSAPPQTTGPGRSAGRH